MPKAKSKIVKRRAINEALQPSGKRGPKRKTAARRDLYVAPDYGTRERWQHATRRFELTDEDGEQLAACVVEECALDDLHLRGVIDDAAREAGLKLRLAYTKAKLAAPTTGIYDARRREKIHGFRGFERTAREEHAYQEWREALLAVPLHSVAVVVSVCCDGQRPRPAQVTALRDGLAALVRYYRL